MLRDLLRPAFAHRLPAEPITGSSFSMMDSSDSPALKVGERRKPEMLEEKRLLRGEITTVHRDVVAQAIRKLGLDFMIYCTWACQGCCAP